MNQLLRSLVTSKGVMTTLGEVQTKSCGAIADGSSHPLSERFDTLAHAQAVYPFATALTQEIDYCACKLASNICFGADSLENGTNFHLNRRLHINGGRYYFGNDTWLIRNLASGHIYGDGKLTTLITGNDIVLQFDGLWYTTLAHFSIAALTDTAITALDIDGNVPGHPYNTRGIQGVILDDMQVSTTGGFAAFYLARQGGSNAQGDNCQYRNLHLSGASFACYFQNGFNCIGNFFIGGDMQSYTTNGAYLLNGSAHFYGTTFESTYGFTQYLNDGWDIIYNGGAYEGVCVYGCSTESIRFVKNLGGAFVDVRACNGRYGAGGWGANHAYVVNDSVHITASKLVFKCTVAGTSSGSEPTWPTLEAVTTVVDGGVTWERVDFDWIFNSTGFVDRFTCNTVVGKISFNEYGQGAINPVTSDYTITEYDNTVFIDATDGPITITVPTFGAGLDRHHEFSVKRIDNSEHAVTVQVATTGSLGASFEAGASNVNPDQRSFLLRGKGYRTFKWAYRHGGVSPNVWYITGGNELGHNSNLVELGLASNFLGQFDNTTASGSIRALTPTLTFSKERYLESFTIASPGVIRLTAHGFQAGQPIRIAGGVRPNEISDTKPYYVNTAGLTEDTFQVTDVNPNIHGAQTSINTTGSFSGEVYVQKLGDDWADFVLPPGNYVNGTDNTTVISDNGARKVRLSGYGARTTDLWFGNKNFGNVTDFSLGTATTAYFASQATSFNTRSVNLKTLADASKLRVGQWVCLMACDMQGTGSYPPNNHYFEFRKITAINSGSGEITFERRLANTYLDTFPLYGAGSGSVFPSGGPAMLAIMHPTWDQDLHIKGLHFNDTGQMYPNTRSFHMEDCYFDGEGIIPTIGKKWVAERCTFVSTSALEFDKLVEYARLKDCVINVMSIQSSSIGVIDVDTCDINLLFGTGKNTKISNSVIGGLTLGTLGMLGPSETIFIENSRITALDYNHQHFSVNGGNMVEGFTWSGGTFSRPISGGTIPWAVPGAKGFVCDMRQQYPNMGSPFAVLDVRTDGTNTLIDTTLTAKPVGISTNATVTIDIASPAVIHWTGHGLTAGTAVAFATTGALPTGLLQGIVYYVIAAGLGVNSFEVSATVGGSAINTSGSQSGVHTGASNPLMLQPHPASRITVRSSTGCSLITDLSDAPDDLPLFSYSRRTYVRNGAGPGGAGLNAIASKQYVWGNLVSMSINVIRAYGGATNPHTVAITANGFNDSLVASNLSLTIDLRTAGLRTITPTSASGSVGVDSIAAYAGWISGAINVLANADNFSADYAIYEIEIVTDQGITTSQVIQTSIPYLGGTSQQVMTDTGIPTAN